MRLLMCMPIAAVFSACYAAPPIPESAELPAGTVMVPLKGVCGRKGQEWTNEERGAVDRGISRLCAALPGSCGLYEAKDMYPVRGEEDAHADVMARAYQKSHCAEFYVSQYDPVNYIQALEFTVVHESMHLAGVFAHTPEGNISSSLDYHINQADLAFVCEVSGIDCSDAVAEIP